MVVLSLKAKVSTFYKLGLRATKVKNMVAHVDGQAAHYHGYYGSDAYSLYELFRVVD